MSVSLFTGYQVSVFKSNPDKSKLRWKEKGSGVRCCNRRAGEFRAIKEKKNYYELLGVSVDANIQEIKEAYRKLQKKYHPDIVGQQGHEYTLKLNEAYKVLMKDDLRKDYDASVGRMSVQFGKNASGLGYSSWKGPLRPEALFVDENACIGCRECVQHAFNTFVMDEATGCARVKVQYGDSDQDIEVAFDSCPVNCIHWVEREELAVLEFLIQPQPVKGYGVFGGGWERPANVFMAAKAFNKQLKEQASSIMFFVLKFLLALFELQVKQLLKKKLLPKRRLELMLAWKLTWGDSPECGSPSSKCFFQTSCAVLIKGSCFGNGDHRNISSSSKYNTLLSKSVTAIQEQNMLALPLTGTVMIMTRVMISMN